MAANDGKKRLVGKVAVVTGAGRGIGRAEAMLLAREGAKVVVNDLGCDLKGKGSDENIAKKVVDKIIAEGGEAVASFDTVATMEGGKRIIAKALDTFGRLDILINNAGIVLPKVIDEMEEEQWDLMVATHLKGHFTTIRHAAPVFRDQRSGVILNTASSSGLGHYGMANYSAVKEGIAGLTRTVARDLGQYNVRCNAIRPVAWTRLTNCVELPETVRISQEVLGIPTMGSWWVPPAGTLDAPPEQVAVLAVWLCTDATNQVNGRIFHVMGNRIGLYLEPELARTIFEPGGWSLDILDSPAARNNLIFGLHNEFLPSRKSE